MNPHSRYANAEHDFNKQCLLFRRICPNLFTALGIRVIIKTRNEERNNLIKRSKIMGKMFEKDGIVIMATQQPIGLILKNRLLFLIPV